MTLRCGTYIGLLFLLGACQLLASDDDMLLMRRDLEIYGTESVIIREQMQAQRTQVVVTMQESERQVANYARLNRQLAAMGQAVVAPTPAITIIGNNTGPMPLEMFDLSDGEMRFVQIGMASTINADDRCFVSHQTFFDMESMDVIYLAALALNLRAGTNLRVDWQFGGAIVYQSSWTAPASLDGQCIAMPLRPSNAPFLPGNWMATLYVNDESYDPAAFNIIEG